MYIQASMELDVSLLERCPHFSVAGFNGVGTFPIREVSSCMLISLIIWAN